MFKLKNDYFKLGLLLGLFILCLLIVLPRIPITYNSRYFNVDTSIGGYNLSLFNGRVLLNLSEFKKGLDLEGGIQLVLSADMSQIEESARASALESARKVIERRVNYLGVSEPLILTSTAANDYRIVVEIPGVGDLSSAVNLIGQTAQIKFKQLKPELPWDESLFQEYYINPDVWIDTGITGADLKGASVVLAQPGATSQGEPQIKINFTNEGRSKFEEVAKNNINKPIAIFLDEGSLPLSMPVVAPELAQGLLDDPVISGNFDLESAEALGVQIRAGALPVPVTIISQKTVGATLGQASVSKSLQAGLYGFVMILIFLPLVYKKLGLVADFALILYALIVLSIFKLMPVVITLPGIAGFLLSVGVAVDANILIFERIKEELSWGRPKSLAVKLGFERAWPAIRDSNVSALITAFILFYMGSGQVRGFALTLAIGVIVSLFTAIIVVRFIIRMLKIDTDSKSRFAFIKRLMFWRKNANNEI